jgi:hypothetical protein
MIPSALSDSDVTQAQQEKAEVPVSADKWVPASHMWNYEHAPPFIFSNAINISP